MVVMSNFSIIKEALTHEMNKFGFVTPIFVVKSELTQIGPFKSP